MYVKRRGLHKVHGNNNNYVLEIKKKVLEVAAHGEPFCQHLKPRILHMQTVLKTRKVKNTEHTEDNRDPACSSSHSFLGREKAK